MSIGGEYRFKIDAYTPDTLPMARLAEYLGDLAIILGETDRVHLVGIEDGSAIVVQKIDQVALPKVRLRVDLVRRGDGPADAMNAFARTNRRLKQDNCSALLCDDNDSEVIKFPGRDEEEAISFGAFNQDGTLDGKVVMVGGKNDPVPVHLQLEGRIQICQANRDVAKDIGSYLFDYELRVRGNGRWLRTEQGEWEMQRFTIHSFELLEDRPLSDIVARLRDVPGSGWREIEDPWGELTAFRDGFDEPH